MNNAPGHAPIAVVIPAFNAGSTLAACLQSILGQSLRPREIIVVDDGSTDDTAAIARQFSADVRLLQQRNRGAAPARQYGTGETQCEYIAYLDADDWWPEHTIATYARLAAAGDIHFLMADFVRAEPGAPPEQYLSRNSSFYPWFLAFARQYGAASAVPGLTCLPADRALEAILRGWPCFPSATLMRRASVLAVGGWDWRHRRCQDFDLALRLARRYPLHYLHDVQAIVGLNQGNRDVTRYVIQQTTGDINVLLTHYQAAQDDETYRRQVMTGLARKYYSLAQTCAAAGDRRGAVRAYWGALRWPGRRTKALLRMLQLALRPASPAAR
jgi:GT2 family glycosyltransferase